MQSERAARISTQNIAPAERARDTMNRYAMCLVRAKQAAVEKALSLEGAEGASNRLEDLATEDCLREGELRMPPALLRGALYRALYIRKHGRNAPKPVSPPADRTKGDTPLRALGYCVADADPTNTRMLVMSSVASEAEKQALTGIMPALAACIPSGQEIKFSRTVLQGALAEAAYLRAILPAVVTK